MAIFSHYGHFGGHFLLTNGPKIIFLPNGVWPPKSDQATVKSKFNFVVEYPIWVSIKRTFTGKLVVGGQNFNYCAQLGENVQKQFTCIIADVLNIYKEKGLACKVWG